MSRSGHQRERRPALLVAQVGRGAHPVDERVAQVRGGLHHAAADEERRGIDDTGQHRAEPAEDVGLLAQDAQRQRVALLGEPAHPLSGLGDRQPGERVPGLAPQPVRQQPGDAAQRRHALRVAAAPARADRHRLVGLEHAVERHRHVPDLAGHAHRAGHHGAVDTTTPPPRPVPTTTDTEEVRAASAPKCCRCAYSAAARASLL